MTNYVSSKTLWVIAIAAVVVIGVLLYWARLSRVPSPDISGMLRQNQAAQRAAAARDVVRRAAEAAAQEAVKAAAEAASPLLVTNPVKKVKTVKITNPFK